MVLTPMPPFVRILSRGYSPHLMAVESKNVKISGTASAVKSRRQNEGFKSGGWWFFTAAAGLIIGLILLYHHFWPLMQQRCNSDNAIALLQGQEIAAGNILLKRWILPPDNLVTVDLPWYAVGVKMFGLNPWLMQGVPLAIFTCLLAVAITAVAWGQRTHPHWLGLLVIVMWLGLASPGKKNPWLLEGPNHVGTTLNCLLALLFLNGVMIAGRMTSTRVVAMLVAAAILTVLTVVGDPMAWILIGGPVLAVAAMRWISRQAGRRDLVILGLVVNSAVGGLLLQSAVVRLGGFKIMWVLPTSFIHLQKLPASVSLASANWLRLFSLRAAAQHQAIEAWLLIFRGVAAALVPVAIIATMLRLLRGREVPLLEAWLAVGAFLMLVACVLSEQAYAAGRLQAHYELPAFIFGIVLAARCVGRRVADIQSFARPITAVMVLVLLSGVPVVMQWFMWPPRVAASQRLASWLDQRHLQCGLSGYWSSFIVTMLSRDRVRLYAVNAHAQRLCPKVSSVDPRWYSHPREPFTFYVFDRRGQDSYPILDRRVLKYPRGYLPPAVLHEFGRPAEQYHYHEYEIAVWKRPLRFTHALR